MTDELEGEPRSWLRYAILSAAEADAHARGYELNAMAIEAEPECLDSPTRKPREERAAFYRGIAATYREQAASSRAMADEERAKRTPVVVDHVAGIPCTMDATD